MSKFENVLKSDVMNSVAATRVLRRRHIAAATALVLAMSWGGTTGAQPAKDQQTFDSAKAAVSALESALDSKERGAVLKLFDPSFEAELLGGDEAAAAADRNQLSKAMKEMYRLRPEGEDRMTLLMGNEVWPLPFPIVRDNGKWYFDTKAGIEEVTNRRIGRNELNAISVANDFVSAQRRYALEDRDGDEVLEYAQRIGSREGRRDGLFWKAEPGEEQSPFGPLVTDARDYLYGRDPGDPFLGYYFRMLTRQGINPPGGRYDYVINGNMIGGFAMLAFPAEYGVSGLKTFVVSQQGRVFEKDLGDRTAFIAEVMDEYNPDETWNDVAND